MMSSRRYSTLGCIEIALRRLKRFAEARLEIGTPLDEINVARKQLLEGELQIKVGVPADGAEHILVKLHHEIQIARGRVERPLHRRSENRQPLHAIFLAQHPHLIEMP